MDTFRNRLEQALRLRNISAAELSRRSGVDKSSISSYLSGRYTASQKKTYSLAKALNVSEAWLMGADVPADRPLEDKRISFNRQKQSFLTVPLYQNRLIIQDGVPTPAILAALDFHAYRLSARKDYFTVEAKDDSMVDIGISPGDLMLFEKCSRPSSNQCFCIISDDEFICRKAIIKTGQIIFQAMNSRYEPLIDLLSYPKYPCRGRLVSVIKYY